MTLVRYAYCGYPSLRQYGEDGVKPNGTEWNAYNLIHAIKSKPFNGYSRITDVNGSTWKITEISTVRATLIGAHWAVKTLAELRIESGYILPIPSSSQTTFEKDTAPRRLAEAIARLNPKFRVAPILAFKEAREADHAKRGKEGEAKPKRQGKQEIIDNLKCSVPKLEGSLILLDDVCTNGYHMKACAEFLRTLGAEVGVALAIGQTIWESQKDAFQIEPLDLEAPPPSFAEVFGGVFD